MKRINDCRDEIVGAENVGEIVILSNFLRTRILKRGIKYNRQKIKALVECLEEYQAQSGHEKKQTLAHFYAIFDIKP